MQRIDPGAWGDAVWRLFETLARQNLAVASILHGSTPGWLAVDQPDEPAFGVAWFHSRVYLAGRLADFPHRAGIQAYFSEVLLPAMDAEGCEGVILHAEPRLLEAAPETLFPSRQIIHAERQHYVWHPPDTLPLPHLPDGYTLAAVDANLAADSGLTGRDWLLEEMVSERPSVEDFLEKSFGVALLHQGAIVGWCLSEYNWEGRCEVGVAVAEDHQRRGLGAAITLGFLQEAYRRGCVEVGWHCWTRNIPSGRLALRAGFQLQEEFPVAICILREAE